MRTLVIGDVHERIDLVERILRRYRGRYDRVCFLGDYFDSWDSDSDQMRQTCRWLAESVLFPNRVHLLGNHDMPYFAPENPQLICPGWSEERQEIFNEECGGIDRGRLHLAVRVGPWVLSHAGFSREQAAGKTPAQLIETARRAKERAFVGIPSNLLGRSPARGFPGILEVPGVTWRDWAEEFRPVAGLHQIVGHSSHLDCVRGHYLASGGNPEVTDIFHLAQISQRSPVPQPREPYVSVNWALDCLRQFVVLIRSRGNLVVLGTNRS